MKTAKEWAESVVVGPECRAGLWPALLDDGAGYVPLERQTETYDAQDVYNDACAIIERFVERVQEDARAPLEREVERLRDENAAMRQQLVDAERTIESLRAENKSPEDGVCKGAEAADMIRVCLVKALRRPEVLIAEVRELVAAMERARLP